VVTTPQQQVATAAVSTPNNDNNKKKPNNKRKPKENNVLQERVIKRQQKVSTTTVAVATVSTSNNPRQKRGKPRSRTSTPQPTRGESPLQPSDSEENNTPNGIENNIATVLFEYFSPQARATSPPAKCRHPHHRMSLPEMNRRATQILEYISSIQVEMASSVSVVPHATNLNSTPLIPPSPSTAPAPKEKKEEEHAGHDPLAATEEDDDNDSLSSASTIPLNQPPDNQHDFDEEPEEEQVDKEKQTSMEIMDMLTRKLIKFQKKFGSRNRALYEEAMMEGEGRITRSREASSNVNVQTNGGIGGGYRNMMAH
jgi:hypothetical protein